MKSVKYINSHTDRLYDDFLKNSGLSSFKNKECLFNFFKLEKQSHQSLTVSCNPFKDISFYEVKVQDSFGTTRFIEFETSNKKINLNDSFTALDNIIFKDYKFSELFNYQNAYFSLDESNKVLYAKIYTYHSVYEIFHNDNQFSITETINSINGNKRVNRKKMIHFAEDLDSLLQIFFIHMAKYLELTDSYKEKIKEYNCSKLDLNFFKISEMIMY